MARGLAPEATSLTDLRVAVPDLATHSLRIVGLSPLAGQTIAESRLREEHGVTVLSVTRDGVSMGNPRGRTPLLPGDRLFVIAPQRWDPGTVS